MPSSARKLEIPGVDFAGNEDKLAPEFLDHLLKVTAESETRFNVLIELHERTYIPPGATTEQVETARAEAVANQQNLLAVLRRMGIGDADITPFWLVNAVRVELPLRQIALLAQEQDVSRIMWLRPERVALLDASAPVVRAPTAWEMGCRGEGVTVAVLDTGIYQDHPWLQGKVVDRISVVTKKEPATGGPHGTHVAGILASIDRQYRGVAPGCRLIDVKVMTNDGDGQLDWLIAGLEWLVERNLGPPHRRREDPIDKPTDKSSSNPTSFPLPSWGSLSAPVANLSLGWKHRCPQHGRRCTACQAVENMVHSGIVTVVAAGNDGPEQGTIRCPGNAPSAITVAATAKDGLTLADYSSRGPGQFEREAKPNLCAPGGVMPEVGIISCVPKDGSDAMEGTSMAAPHVAGACAILLGRYPHLRPPEVKRILMASTRKLEVSPTKQGAGMLDIAAALAIAAQEVTPGLIPTHTLIEGFLQTCGIDPVSFWANPANYVPNRYNLHPDDEAFVFHLEQLRLIEPSAGIVPEFLYMLRHYYERRLIQAFAEVYSINNPPSNTSEITEVLRDLAGLLIENKSKTEMEESAGELKSSAAKERKREWANAQLQIGVLSLLHGNLEKAQECFQEAQPIFKGLDYGKREAKCCETWQANASELAQLAVAFAESDTFYRIKALRKVFSSKARILRV